MSVNTYLPPSPVVPGFLLISAITQKNPMVVTVVDSIYNTYIVGQLVHLTVPQDYGMTEADQMTGEIVSIDDVDFTLNINATNFSAFVSPDPDAIPPPRQPATLAPAGSRNNYNNLVVPFHSIGNQGN